MDLTLEQASAWLRRFASVIQEQKEYLTDLDAAIGDADHGINMDRGMQAVCQKLDEAPPDSDLGARFKLVGSTLVSTVGGASGPLYGTAFLRMGGALNGKTSASAQEMASALDAAYEGMAARGKSKRGEKTLLDAFGPALNAFRQGAGEGRGLPEVAVAAAAAAADGAKATTPLRAVRGRASFLGENSIGRQDPGATSTLLLFQALADVLQS